MTFTRSLKYGADAMNVLDVASGQTAPGARRPVLVFVAGDSFAGGGDAPTVKPLVVGLYASPERIVQIRQNRLLTLNAQQTDSAYVDRQAVSDEIATSKRLCAQHGWPSIDVSRRSIEETAAAVIALLQERRREGAGQP